MADRPVDAADPAVDPVAAGLRCPLLVIAAVELAAREGGAGPDGVGADAEAAAPAAADGGGLPSVANRCAASQPPAAVSLGQQRLVCFDVGHVDCPRYVRATGSPRGSSGRSGRPAPVAPIALASVVSVAAADPRVVEPVSGESTAVIEPTPGPVVPAASETPAPPLVPVAPVVRSTRRSGARPVRSRPRPVIVAGAILVAALVVAFVFTSLRGGLAMPSAGAGAGATASVAAAASIVASPVVNLTALPTASPSEGSSLSPSPSPSVVPSPTLSPNPPPTPTATPVATPGPSLPTAFQELTPCPDRADCYLYRVHSGDSLIAIAKHFGITVVALKAANPEIKDPSLLHVGAKIRIPLPTS